MTIYKAISDIMKEMEAVGKNRDNKMQGFKFRGIDDLYNELHPRLAKHGVFTVPEVIEERREERPTKSGGISQTAIMKIRYTFFASDGSCVTATVIGEGADTGDKASTKAMAIAHKYALLQVFSIPTEEQKDPDGESVEYSGKASVKHNSKAHKTVEALKKIRVTEGMVLSRYGVNTIDQLSDSQVTELNEIGRAIHKDKKPIADFFKG